MSNLPDYYAILRIDPSASQEQIRTGYRKESLRTHPDRVEPARRKKATEDFQKVADAYYVLSDPSRRANYDAQRTAHPGGFSSTDAGASADYFANFFRSTFGAAANEHMAEESDSDDEEPRKRGGSARPDADATFGDVFEDLLRPEVHRVVPLWTWAGAAAGMTMGFIVGNLPGAAIGAYGGSRVGAIRDAKGKAVYEVFKDLGAGQRAEILRGLAAKVLGSALG